MSAQMQLAVSCKGIEKSFGESSSKTLALRGADLDVQQGELLMLVGPSGCGKTTLISIIAGILDYDKGSCHVLGHDYAQMNQRQKTLFRAPSIGFVFQAYNLIPTLSVAENVTIPALLNGHSRRHALELAMQSLKAVGIADKAHQAPQNLSGGQQQRVAIARALIHKPSILVADEPTSALDHENGIKVMQLFREVALSQSRSLIIVTHDSRMYQFADRIAYMEDGRVIEIVTDQRIK